MIYRLSEQVGTEISKMGFDNPKFQIIELTSRSDQCQITKKLKMPK